MGGVFGRTNEISCWHVKSRPLTKNLWYNSSHLYLLFLVATVSHLIRPGDLLPAQWSVTQLNCHMTRVFFGFSWLLYRMLLVGQFNSINDHWTGKKDHLAWRSISEDTKNSKSRWPELYHKCYLKIPGW